MNTTAERLAALETMVSEIHLAVVGDGRDTLVARCAVSEAEIANLKGWRHKALAGIAQTLLSVAAAIVAGTLGVHLPGRTS